MANQSASIVSGKLTAEEAERLAASFRPAWELDDAPFEQGSSLSAAEMAALEGGGVNSDVRAVAAPPTHAQVATTVPKPAHVAPLHEEAVIVEVDFEPVAQPVVQPVAQQQPQPVAAVPQQRERITAPAMRPIAKPASAADSGEYVPIKKTNKGLFIGIGAAVAVVALVLVVRAVTHEEPKATPTTQAADQPTQQGRSIPPPPPITDIAPTTTTAAANPTVDKPVATATTAAPVTPPVVNTAPPTIRPTTASGTTGTKPATKPTTKSGGGGIVRDVQF